MSVTLKWANSYNGNVSGFKIYRSLLASTLYDPSNLIATVPTETLDYLDPTAAVDVPYFYGVESLTELGTMQSKPITAIQYMNTAGPGNITTIRGNLAAGMLDATSASNMTDLWELCNGIQRSASVSVANMSIRATMNPVPGYREDLVGKFSIKGAVQFFPADYRNHVVHTTVSGRQAFDEGIVATFANGVKFDYLGYPMQMELMDLDVCMDFWIRWAGGPNNSNGWIPRAVEKPIPAYANHYVLVKKDGKPYRVRATDARPYLQTAVEATTTDPFTTSNYAYPLWVIKPVP